MQTFGDYLRQEGIQSGLQLGRQEGMQLSAYEAKRDVSKKMLAEGVNRETRDEPF